MPRGTISGPASEEQAAQVCTGSISGGVWPVGMTLGQGVPKTTQLKATSQHTKTLPTAAPRQVGTLASLAKKGSRWASGDGVA